MSTLNGCCGAETGEATLVAEILHDCLPFCESLKVGYYDKVFLRCVCRRIAEQITFTESYFVTTIQDKGTTVRSMIEACFSKDLAMLCCCTRYHNCKYIKEIPLHVR